MSIKFCFVIVLCYHEFASAFSSKSINETKSCENMRGYVPCRDRKQCIRISGMCDGFTRNCADGSDEDEEFCKAYECQYPLVKCKNGIQCVWIRNFCDKRKPGKAQYQCKDKSDESVWGCKKGGKTCTPENHLWSCQPNNESSLCIHESKVCNGARGLRTNNCENGEDEDKDHCNTYVCPKDYVKCQDKSRCVHVGKLCDGVDDCLDGSDEYRLQIDLNETMNDCNVPGTPCIAISSQFWLDSGRRGIRCHFGQCLEASKVCDGSCDCPDSNCIDEQDCIHHRCLENTFQCSVSGICVENTKICDGNFDCGVDDASDESECPCQGQGFRRNSVYFRHLLISLMSLKCGNEDSAPNLDCLRRIRMKIRPVLEARKMEILLSEKCGFESPCEIQSVRLWPNIPPPNLLSSQPVNTPEFFHGAYGAAIHLPGTSSLNFSYVYNPRIQSSFRDLNHQENSQFFPHDLTERLALALNLVGRCDIRHDVHRLDFINRYQLPTPFYKDTKDYFYQFLRREIFNYELLFSLEPNCPEEGSNIFNLTLNDFFPTVTYGDISPKDHANMNITVFLFSHPACPRAELNKAELTLLTLVAFHDYKHNKTDGKKFQNIICQKNVRVFQYEYSDTNVTFLIISADQSKRSPGLSFSIRLENGISGFSKILTVRVDFRILPGRTFLHGNKNFFHWYFYDRKSDEKIEQIRRLEMPRRQRKYLQTSGNVSLPDVLASHNVTHNFRFFRICREKLETLACKMEEALTHLKQIEQALNSRWSLKCLLVEIDSNSYLILPSQVDQFLLIEQDVFGYNDSQLHVQHLPGDGKQAPSDPQTKLVTVGSRFRCQNQNIKRYPDFYYTTLVSASVNGNKQCALELCHRDTQMYYEYNRYTFLGPFNALWDSPCVTEFGFMMMKQLMRSRGATVNKYWISQHFSYFVMSLDKNFTFSSNEAAYLSGWALFAELGQVLIMGMIAMITIFGNLFVFLAIAFDNSTKKSVYQYFQMSLCLADVTMGLAGAGEIIVVNLMLIFGKLDTSHFIEGTIFLELFESPQEAVKAGLNNFFFIVDRIGLVIAGTLVSLSTTVSLILVCAMAFTRYQAVVSPGKQCRIFAFINNHVILACVIPWPVGAVLTFLHFVDFIPVLEMRFQAFFDPVSKISILLPASQRPVNFFLQIALIAALLALTLTFTLLAWIIINENSRHVKERNMISQQHQLMKRLAEERRWLHLTLAIFIGLASSILPVSTFYLLSIYKITLENPGFQVAAWWLFVSGSLFNLLIYSLFNVNTKKSLALALNNIRMKLRCCSSRNSRKNIITQFSRDTEATNISATRGSRFR